MKAKQILFFIIFIILSPLWAYIDCELFQGYRLFYWHLMYLPYAFFLIYLLYNKLKINVKQIVQISLSLVFLFIYYLIRSLFINEEELSGLYITSFSWVLPLLLLLIIIYNSTIREKHIKIAISLIKVTLIVAFLFTFIQLFFNSDFFVFKEAGQILPADTTDQYSRLPSMFSFLSSNEIGFSFLPLFSILLAYQIKEKEKASTIIFWLCIAGFVALLTNARYVIFGFFIICSQLIFNGQFAKNRVKSLSVFLIVIILFYFFVGLVGYDFDNYVTEKLFSQTSNEARITSYFMFLNYFPENPIFGAGVRASRALWSELGNSESFMQIHIGYLSHLYEFGIVGSLFLFSFYLFVVKKFVQTLKFSKFSGGLFAMIAFLFANLTLVEYSLFYYGFILVFVFDRYYSKKESIT
jgi:O-antigen ligase